MSDDKRPESFWDEFHELREQKEQKLLNDINHALHDSPRVVADLLRAWMKADKTDKPPR